ncbi:AAA family ATPase, partial [Helicobacter typhlonius]
MQIYVLGVHTDTGKTHFSAAFCKAFSYDYFKLIQAGVPTDSDFVKTLSPTTHIFESGIFLQTPASPHLGKKIEHLHYKAFD